MESDAKTTKVTSIDLEEHKLGSTVLDADGSYYKGYFDEKTGELYLGTMGFSTAGKLDIFDGVSGTFRSSVSAGIAPAHFAFYH
jgi:hypothetical protein